MKKILLLFAVIMTAVSASAENYILYTSSDGQVVTPNRTNVFGVNIVSNTYEDGQGKIVFDGEITSIGNSAFYKCNLVSIVIPNSVTKMGSMVFNNCTDLVSVVIPNSVPELREDTFRGCINLKAVTIGNSVAKIGKRAFYNCSSLEAVAIPNSVTTIGQEAFANCSGLKSIELPNSVTTINNAAFSGCTNLVSVVIPESATTIGGSAFWGCSSLKSVEILSSAAEIEEGAFSGCGNLEAFYGKFASDDNRCLIVNGALIAFAAAGLSSYTIPSTVTEILGSAFYNCTNLKSVEIPYSVTDIKEDVFFGCGNLEAFYGKFASDDNRCLIANGVLVAFIPKGVSSYTIPSYTTKIGGNVFYGCTELESVVIPNSVTEIRPYAFYGCSALTSVELGNSVTTIEAGAFCRCYNLKSVVIPETVTHIGSSAFEECHGLSSVVIGNSVATIEGWAFRKCYYLRSVILPASVTDIGVGLFRDCWSLEEITSLNTTPPSTIYTCFDNSLASYCVLKVPAVAVEAYRAAEGWSIFPRIIGILGNVADNNIEYEIASDNTALVNGVQDIPETGEVVIPETLEVDDKVYTVTKIAVGSFRGNTAITSVVIPATISEIGDYAFAGCNNLAEVTCLSTIPPFISANTFEGILKSAGTTRADISTCVLKVPAEAVDAYMAADYWKEFANIIAIESVGIENAGSTTCNAAMYNLQGIKVSDGYKGIVIKNGKKVMAK